MIKEIFDQAMFMQRQIVDALTCPVNRDCTRREYACDDWELYKHPEWLIRHYIEKGGATEFAKRRADFIQVVEVPDTSDNLDGIEYVI